MSKVKVEVLPDFRTGEVWSEDEVLSAMRDAGWTDDPRDGVTAMLPNGQEVLNPIPIAPPIGYNNTPSMFDIIRAQIAAARRAGDDDVVDSAEDMNDFDMEDDIDPSSIYEIQMRDDFPELVKAVDPPPPVTPPPPSEPAK